MRSSTRKRVVLICILVISTIVVTSCLSLTLKGLISARLAGYRWEKNGASLSFLLPKDYSLEYRNSGTSCVGETFTISSKSGPALEIEVNCLKSEKNPATNNTTDTEGYPGISTAIPLSVGKYLAKFLDIDTYIVEKPNEYYSPYDQQLLFKQDDTYMDVTLEITNRQFVVRLFCQDYSRIAQILTEAELRK